MKRPLKTTHLWYNERLDTLITGKWVETKKFLFFKDYKYKVQFMEGTWSMLPSPKALEESCKLVDAWREE